jgi:hypothetical protein
MPASFIQHEHGNGACQNALADDGEMFVHRFDVDLGHNNRRTSAAFRTDRTEQIGGFETTIARRAWARGRVPRFAQIRVSVPCWPTRASSPNHTSTGLPAASVGSAALMRAGNAA